MLMKKSLILTIACVLSLFTNDCFAKIRVGVEGDTTLVFNGSGRLKAGDTSWEEQLPAGFNWDNINKIAFTGVDYTIDAGYFRNFKAHNLQYVSLYKARIISIGNNAFADNANLKNVVVGQLNETTEFGTGVFSGCPNLTSVGGSSAGIALLNTQLKNDKGNYETYKINAVPANLCNGMEYLELVVIVPRLTEIKSGAFSNCPSLIKAEIPDTLITLGDEAFKDCPNLISVKYRNNGERDEQGAKIYQYNLQNIGSSVFENDVNFAKYSAAETASNNNAFIIPATIQSVGKNVFKGCTSVKSVGTTSKCNVQLLGSEIIDNMFSGADGLETVKAWPNGLTSIGNYAFDGCTSLNSVPKFPAITEIGNFAFQRCQFETANLNNANNSLTKIGEGAFAYNGKLTNFAMPKSITQTGKDIFRDCTYLTNVITKIVKDSINPSKNYVCVQGDIIPAYAFCGMTKLKTIKLGANITFIGDSAFADCRAINQVTLNWKSELLSVDVAANAFDFTNTDKFTRAIIPLTVSESYLQDFCEYEPWNNEDIFYVKNARKYTRTVKSGVMSTICLPYAFIAPKNMTLYEIVGTKYNSETGKSTFCVDVADIKKTEPGRPYLFRYSGTDLSFYQLNGKFAVVADQPVDASETNGLVGKFNTETIPYGDGTNNYIYKNNSLYHVTTAVKSGDNKAYIDMSLVPSIGNNDATAKSYFEMDFDGLSDETSINGINVAAKSAKKIFNLSGQEVKEVSKSGVYIVNGKKMYINK